MRADNVVPFAVKSAGSDVHGLHFSLGNLAAFVIGFGIELGLHDESCLCTSRTDQIDDDLVRFKGLPSPIAGDVTEHTVFDLVPLAGTRWKVADFNRLADFIGELLELQLPEATPTAVAASAVRRDQ